MIKSSSLLFFFPFFWLRKNVCIRLTQSYTTHGYITHRSFRLLSLSHINQSEHKNPILSKEKKNPTENEFFFVEFFFWRGTWNEIILRSLVCVYIETWHGLTWRHTAMHTKCWKLFIFSKFCFDINDVVSRRVKIFVKRRTEITVDYVCVTVFLIFGMGVVGYLFSLLILLPFIFFRSILFFLLTY